MHRQRFNFPFTKLPQVLVDDHLKELSGSETKMFLVILRQTVGWGKRDDMIALSQFKKLTGNSIPTIRKALKGLQEKNLVDRNCEGKTYSYKISDKFLHPKEDQIKDQSERNLHVNGKDSFSNPCKKVSPQKINTKIKLNTTSCNRSKSRDEVSKAEVVSVIELWNEKFKHRIKTEKKWTSLIRKVLCYFSLDEVKKAMQNRLNSEFYKNRIPLLHNPKCFFGWLETIENDLNRKSSNIFTYEERNRLIANEGFKDEDFEMAENLKDDKGWPLWELKKNDLLS